MSRERFPRPEKTIRRCGSFLGVIMAALLTMPQPGAAAEGRSACTDSTVPRWWSNFRADGLRRGKFTGAGSERRRDQEEAEKAATASAKRDLSAWLHSRFYAATTWYATQHESSSERVTLQRISDLVEGLVEGYVAESRKARVDSFERCDGHFAAYALVEIYADAVSSDVAREVIVDLSGERAYRSAAVVQELEKKLEEKLVASIAEPEPPPPPGPSEGASDEPSDGAPVQGVDIAGLQADVERRIGAWTTRFNVSASSRPPEIFNHYFIVMQGSNFIARGSIVTGCGWDRSSSPMWKVKHGWVRRDAHSHLLFRRLTYLGPTMRREFIDLAEAVHSEGGRDLGEKITYDGAFGGDF